MAVLAQNASPGSLFIPSRPTTYTLELTSRCNSQCLGCGNVFERSLGEMSVGHWQVLFQSLTPHIINLRLTGGEPTLHAQFPQLLQLVDSLGVPFVIFTNGLWLHPEQILELLVHCRNLDGLLISLHGKDAPTHRAFAGIDSYRRITTAIRSASEAGIRVNTNTVLTRANYLDIPEIANLSLALGATYAAFSRYYGPPLCVTDLHPDEFRRAAQRVAYLKEQGWRVIFNNCIPICFDSQETKRCPAGITHCTINPQGQVRPCTHSPNVLGDLFEKDILEIWQGPEVEEWRNQIHPDCHNCAEFTRCRGGCKALAYHLGCAIDPLARQPLDEPLASDKPHHVQLYAKARPRTNFTLRQESFGYLLVNRNQIVPVSLHAQPILESLDGKTTLQQIRERYGDQGLQFVANLFYKGLLYLDQDPIPSEGSQPTDDHHSE